MAVVPKSGLAMPIFPFHFGSSRSLIPLGRSASATSLVLTIRMRARAAKPYQVPSLALNVSGRSPAWLGWNGASKPFSLSRSVFRISLFQNRSHRGRAASAMIRFVRPTVLVLSTSNLGRTWTPLCFA